MFVACLSPTIVIKCLCRGRGVYSSQHAIEREYTVLSNPSSPHTQKHKAGSQYPENARNPADDSQPDVAKSVGLSLRRNFIWTLAGNLVYSACQWGMLIALAKLGSPELVGRFALALAITAPVILLLNLQLRAVQATDARIDYRFGDYLALRTITAALAMALISGIAIAVCKSWSLTVTVIAVGAAKAIESMSDIHYGLLQRHERMDRIAISSAIKGPLALVAIALGVYFTGGVMWGPIFMAVCVAGVLLAYDIPCARKMMDVVGRLYQTAGRSPMRPAWNRERLTGLARLSAPLGVTMMLISLNANIPRYFIARHSGERELGIFAAMSYLLVAGAIAIGALADSATPRLSKHYAARDARSYSRLLARLVGIGAMAGAVAIGIAAWAGHWVLLILYGPEYAQYPLAFTWIAVASAIGFVGWFLGTGMTAARCFRVQVALLGSNTLITVAASALLIPRFGLVGAALALVIANAALALGTLAVVAVAIVKIKRPKHTEDYGYGP